MRNINKLSKHFLVLFILPLFLATGCSDDSTEEEVTVDDSSSDITDLSDTNTVGLLLNSADAYNGYTLFGTLRDSSVYLIDNCGEEVQSWDTDYTTKSVYMLENGNLLHTATISSVQNDELTEGGGHTGRVELLNPDGEVEWYYEIDSDTQLMHHDVEYIESSDTILVMVWEERSAAETAAAGYAGGTELWSEKIIELDPNATSEDDVVVWEWDAWDHLVQDHDASKSNYGVVSEKPGLININFSSGEEEYYADWLHANGVDYNAELDQIVVSVRNFSEFWIIDHSTTTAQAATDEGGNQGKGGSILYRWGNPQTYDMGDQEDQQLFLQHDANWIDEDYTDEDLIMVFNNQAGYNEGVDYSTVDVIDTNVDSSGAYELETTGLYAPDEPSWSYEADERTDFYSSYISGARRLPNGNTLITEGASGTFFEVTYDGEVVWKYINPVDSSGILTQGESPSENMVFRSSRYATDYAGMAYYSLSENGTIESGSDYECELYEND